MGPSVFQIEAQAIRLALSRCRFRHSRPTLISTRGFYSPPSEADSSTQFSPGLIFHHRSPSSITTKTGDGDAGRHQIPLPFRGLGPAGVIADRQETRLPEQVHRILLAIERQDTILVIREVVKGVQVEREKRLPIFRYFSPRSFSALLKALYPAPLIESYKRLSCSMSVRTILELRARFSGHGKNVVGFKELSALFGEGAHVIKAVISSRQAAGYRLNLNDYASVLHFFYATGDMESAVWAWGEMLNNGIVADTRCYNFILGAICMSGAYLPLQRQKLRVIPFHMSMRSQPLLDAQFEGFRVGEHNGIRQNAVSVLRDMIRQGVQPDALTYERFMIAIGREGDIAGVKKVLLKVWNVDVDAVMYGKESSLPPPRAFTKGSTFWPSSTMLHAIAEIFGSNNDIPTALRLIDYFQRHYNLRLQTHTAHRLLEWTFVLSNSRARKRSEAGELTGKLPSAAVLNLWNTLVQAPYMIKPTIPMYDLVICSLSDRSVFEKMLDKMREALKLMHKSRSRCQKLERRLYTPNIGNGVHASVAAGCVPSMHLQWKAEIRRTTYVRDVVLMRRWCRFVLGRRKWARYGERGEYSVQLRGIPAALEEWADMMPRHITYGVPGGMVSIKRFDRRYRRNAKCRR